MDPELPKTLAEAMATEPLWLRAWIQVLIAVNMAAVLFIVGRSEGRWRIRWEPIAILGAFFGAVLAMGALYDAVGYVRLLGLAHLVFWGPVWAWILWHRAQYPLRSAFGIYLHVYLVIAGISLLIDALDVVRYLLGDGDLLGRGSGG
ncbi:MAG: hypothetical protein ACX98W_03890 [bacterium]